IALMIPVLLWAVLRFFEGTTQFFVQSIAKLTGCEDQTSFKNPTSQLRSSALIGFSAPPLMSYIMNLDFIVKNTATHSEEFRSVLLDPITHLERFEDCVTLQIIKLDAAGRYFYLQ